jgi:cardiolipin synthase A/B
MMAGPPLASSTRRPSDDLAARKLAEQAISRAAGAPLVGGNSIELLIDAPANYAAWLKAMRASRHSILLENYIIRDDVIGREFREVLVQRAKAGLEVYVIYDWLGCIGNSGARFWKPLIDAGGKVRCYNPFRFSSPLGWINRDHRKLLLIDREIAFVGGLCISEKWLGDPKRDRAPWRDTAVSVRGPVVTEFERAFSDIWVQLGTPLQITPLPELQDTGEIDVRVVATEPDTAGVFRLDQMIAAMARHSLWLSDAYFVGLSPYVQALAAAARDGVDVRLLVPGASDLPVVASMSRSGYRPLLEAGVRVFEWNGAMMHAKTAVADGRWARVGSSNLNISSWMGNCELDIAVENKEFARQMEEQYLRDLENATEIVLTSRQHIRAERKRMRVRRAGGSSGRAAASALRLAHTVGAALGNRRVIGKNEANTLPWSVIPIFLFASAVIMWPRLLAWPAAVFACWAGLALVARYIRLRTNVDAPPLNSATQKEAFEDEVGTATQSKSQTTADIQTDNRKPDENTEHIEETCL